MGRGVLEWSSQSPDFTPLDFSYGEKETKFSRCSQRNLLKGVSQDHTFI